MRGVLLALILAGCGGAPDFYADCDTTETDACADVVPEGADGVCLEKSGGGFCTWHCAVDADCAEDFDDHWDFVCSPLESNEATYCFPACATVEQEGDQECPDGYGCRSTGGGSENEKICFPDGL